MLCSTDIARSPQTNNQYSNDWFVYTIYKYKEYTSPSSIGNAPL